MIQRNAEWRGRDRDRGARARRGGEGVTEHGHRFESGRGGLRERTVDAIRAALEAAGVEFTNEDQPGVRLRKEKPLLAPKPGRA